MNFKAFVRHYFSFLPNFSEQVVEENYKACKFDLHCHALIKVLGSIL